MIETNSNSGQNIQFQDNGHQNLDNLIGQEQWQGQQLPQVQWQLHGQTAPTVRSCGRAGGGDALGWFICRSNPEGSSGCRTEDTNERLGSSCSGSVVSSCSWSPSPWLDGEVAGTATSTGLNEPSDPVSSSKSLTGKQTGWYGVPDTTTFRSSRGLAPTSTSQVPLRTAPDIWRHPPGYRYTPLSSEAQVWLVCESADLSLLMSTHLTGGPAGPRWVGFHARRRWTGLWPVVVSRPGCLHHWTPTLVAFPHPLH